MSKLGISSAVAVVAIIVTLVIGAGVGYVANDFLGTKQTLTVTNTTTTTVQSAIAHSTTALEKGFVNVSGIITVSRNDAEPFKVLFFLESKSSSNYTAFVQNIVDSISLSGDYSSIGTYSLTLTNDNYYGYQVYVISSLSNVPFVCDTGLFYLFTINSVRFALDASC